MNIHTHPSRRGFILVMTLMLLSIVAVALASAGRASMMAAVGAVQAQQELQRRWGNASSRQACLQLAPIILDMHEADGDLPRHSVSIEARLGDYTYELTLSDEQAKVNINMMLAIRGRETTRAFVRQQCDSQPWSDEIVLPMRQASNGAGDTGTRDRSYKQIVSINHLLPSYEPMAHNNSYESLFNAMTVWGDGRINITQAPSELVTSILRPLLGVNDIKRIRRMLASEEGIRLSDALDRVGLAPDDALVVMNRLTDESRCYSIWINVSNQRRHWCELAVLELEPKIISYKLADNSGKDDAEPIDSVATDVPLRAADISTNIDGGSQAPSGQAVDGKGREAGTYPRLLLFQW